MFSSIQAISKVINFDERVAFVDQAVDRMESLLDRSYPAERRNFRDVVAVKKELEGGLLKLLQKDKSGELAILPSTVFERKSSEALNSLFVEWRGKVCLMSHKVDMPFRVVVNEHGTWQHTMSRFLLQGLNLVKLEKSLAHRNSNELISVLEGVHRIICSIVSMDIKDLYYSQEKVV